jgi:hypothetical protein
LEFLADHFSKWSSSEVTNMNCFMPSMWFDLVNTEASSRIYSPYVFALSQLFSEIPYSLLSAVLYWVSPFVNVKLILYDIFIRSWCMLTLQCCYELLTCFMYRVWPMGFGKGASGTNGNGYQLLIFIFLGLFSVSLGQFIAAISPSIHVCIHIYSGLMSP